MFKLFVVWCWVYWFLLFRHFGVWCLGVSVFGVWACLGVLVFGVWAFWCLSVLVFGVWAFCEMNLEYGDGELCSAK